MLLRRMLAHLAILVIAASAAAGRNAAARSGRALALRAFSLEDTPVHRVVTLLQEMKAELEKAISADTLSYDKMVCWCDGNDKAKSKAISAADAQITELVSEVGSRGGRDGELGAKIAQLKQEIVGMKAGLAQAIALRENEHAAFSDEEKEMVQAVTMLKNAILVLSRHHAGLLQLTPAMQESLGSALRWAALKHEEMLTMATEGSPGSQPRPGVRSQAQLAAVGSRAKPAAAVSLLSLVKRALQAGTAAAGGAAPSSVDDTVLRAFVGAGNPSAAAFLPAKYAMRILASAVAREGESFAQQPAHLQSYSPQSGQIFAILKQMQEEFEANLAAAQKHESKAQEDFAQLKVASDKQITSSAEALDSLEADHSANAKALSDTKQDLAATREGRGADVGFLSDLRLKCQAVDKDWKDRSSAQREELTAVAEAISILTEDDARDLHRKLGTAAAAASLLQRTANAASHRDQAIRAEASALLLHAASVLGSGRREPATGDLYKAWHSTEDRPHDQLAAMSVRVQLDAFAKVNDAIDGMVQQLKGQQQDEVKHKAQCASQLKANNKMVYSTREDLEDVQNRIGSLQSTIQKMVDGITAAKEEIARMEVEIKKASEVREMENKEFQQEVSDQRAMQNILKKAITRLRMVYKSAEALAQQPGGPTPPGQFRPYKQNAGSKSVISLLEAIVQDSMKVENDSVSAEQEAQKAYQLLIRDSNKSIKRLQEIIEEKTATKASAEVEEEEAQAHATSTHGELQDLVQYATDLHAECDFLMKNFDVRQSALTQEIEALRGAKAFLSGMSADDD